MFMFWKENVLFVWIVPKLSELQQSEPSKKSETPKTSLLNTNKQLRHLLLDLNSCFWESTPRKFTQNSKFEIVVNFDLFSERRPAIPIISVHGICYRYW